MYVIHSSCGSTTILCCQNSQKRMKKMLAILLLVQHFSRGKEKGAKYQWNAFICYSNRRNECKKCNLLKRRPTKKGNKNILATATLRGIIYKKVTFGNLYKKITWKKKQMSSLIFSVWKARRIKRMGQVCGFPLLLCS